MYSLKMINRNGYCISGTFPSIASAKRSAAFYPLDAFFSWIYDTDADRMACQNEWGRGWRRCDNATFIPYHL